MIIQPWQIIFLIIAVPGIVLGLFMFTLKDPERKEGLTSQIKNLIKSVEGGGPIPDEMIQTIRHDPKFAEISKTRSTDPD